MARVARRFLQRVWAEQAGSGHVFCSVKDWDDGHWEDHDYGFPLGDDFRLPTTNDLYFAPNIYEAPQRRKELALPGRWLYADLDEVDPRTLELGPTVAWETSPGRYQCLWLLERAIRPQLLGPLNQKLTYFCGADKGGWSLTKVLRVPGSVSHKRDHAYRVQSLWLDGPSYAAADIYRLVKATETPRDVIGKVPKLKLPSASASRLKRRHWERLPLRAKQLLKATEATKGTRSERLWELQRLLLEAGLKPEHVFVIVKASVWNKYRGQGREDQQLWREIQQAVKSGKSGTGSKRSAKSSSVRGSKKSRQGSSSKQQRRLSLTSYDDFIDTPIHRPSWMVEGIWSESAHGVIAGDPKTYKSVISTDLAMSVASGTMFLDHFPVPQVGPVFLIQKENDEGEVQDRLMRIGHSKRLMAEAELKAGTLSYKPNTSLPVHVMNNRDFDLTDEGDIRWLRRCIRKHQPVLVVLDPLYLLAPGVDENSAHEMTPILARLLKIKQRYNCGTLLIHHYKKQDQKNPTHGPARISGTGAFHRWYESALLLERPDLSIPSVRLTPDHRGHSPQGVAWATFDLGTDTDLHYSVDIERPREKAAEDASTIRDIVEQVGGVATLQQLIREMGQDRKAVERKAVKAGLQVKKAGGRVVVVSPNGKES